MRCDHSEARGLSSTVKSINSKYLLATVLSPAKCNAFYRQLIRLAVFGYVKNSISGLMARGQSSAMTVALIYYKNFKAPVNYF
jgi:hypothetical protein